MLPMSPGIFKRLTKVTLAFLRESFDRGIRGVAEAEQVTGMPILAVVPRERHLPNPQTTAQPHLHLLSKPESHYVEAIRSLRNSLLLSNAAHPPKILLFTSAKQAEGKTTTATNMACALAQSGSRVLLIDADLRRPNVHHHFGLSSHNGLSNILAGMMTLQAAVQSIEGVPGLDVLASGAIPPFPMEMLSSLAMENLLLRAGELYEYVMIDSAPVLSAHDAVTLAPRVDAAVMIVRYGKASRQSVRRGCDLLVRSGAQLAGVVLNAAPIKR